jgi:hypothetical protein
LVEKKNLFLRVNFVLVEKTDLLCVGCVVEDVKGKTPLISTQPQSTKHAHNYFVWKVSLVG